MPGLDSGPGSANSALLAFGAGEFSMVEAVPDIVGRMLSGIPRLCPPEAVAVPPHPTPTICDIGHCQMSPEGKRVSPGCPRPFNHGPSGVSRAVPSQWLCFHYLRLKGFGAGDDDKVVSQIPSQDRKDDSSILIRCCALGITLITTH